ncbi:MAG: hypothetical protein JOY80_10910 [Candidatus Dormibacteraeota bacterium]|nr:hypothetical protein [Candidatus Dormibacteraeota bacterium]
MTPPDDFDPAAYVAAAQRDVEARREADGYSAALIKRLAERFPNGAAVAMPEEFARIEAARPIESRTPVGAVAKRMVRKLIAWYVSPIAADQTRFNDALLVELRSLQARIDRLEAAKEEASAPDPRP